MESELKSRTEMESEIQYREDHPGRIRVYDVNFDGFRDATQLDIDLLMTTAFNWATMRDEVMKLAGLINERHDIYKEKAKSIWFVKPGDAA